MWFELKHLESLPLGVFRIGKQQVVEADSDSNRLTEESVVGLLTTPEGMEFSLLCAPERYYLFGGHDGKVSNETALRNETMDCLWYEYVCVMGTSRSGVKAPYGN